MSIIGKSTVLAELLEIMCNGDLVYWFLKLDEEIVLVLQVIAFLGMPLMPALRPGGVVVLEADGNLRDTEELVTPSLSSLICMLKIHFRPLSSYI